MERYVIKSETGMYIGIDMPSGGYPYETKDLIDAKMWFNKESAFDYKKHFPNERWNLYIVRVDTESTTWE